MFSTPLPPLRGFASVFANTKVLNHGYLNLQNFSASLSTQKWKASKIECFAQLETIPNNRTSGSLVKLLEDEVKPSNKVPLRAWTRASGQLNPALTKYFILQQNSQNPNSVSILIVSPTFTSERLKIKNFPLWQDLVHPASLILIETWYFNFQTLKISEKKRMDLSLEPWLICKLSRQLLLPHTQMKPRIKRM